MYTFRTNVLLSEEEHQLLSYLSQQEGMSMGALIRKAITKTYGGKQGKAERKQPKRVDQRVVSLITANWSMLGHGDKKLDYQELVADGRKY